MPFLPSARFYKIIFFTKNLSGIPLKCQQLGFRETVGPALGPNCVQRLKADDISRHGYEYTHLFNSKCKLQASRCQDFCVP